MSEGATQPEQWHIVDRLITQILESHRALLCSCLDPSRFYTFLRSKGVLTRDDQEDIDSHTITSRRAGRLLDILISHGYNGFGQLCHALNEDGTQVELLKTLNEEYQHGLAKLQESMSPSAEYDDTYLPAPGDPGAPSVSTRTLRPPPIPALDILNEIQIFNTAERLSEQSFLEMRDTGDVSHA